MRCVLALSAIAVVLCSCDPDAPAISSRQPAEHDLGAMIQRTEMLLGSRSPSDQLDGSLLAVKLSIAVRVLHGAYGPRQSGVGASGASEFGSEDLIRVEPALAPVVTQLCVVATNGSRSTARINASAALAECAHGSPEVMNAVTKLLSDSDRAVRRNGLALIEALGADAQVLTLELRERAMGKSVDDRVWALLALSALQPSTMGTRIEEAKEELLEIAVADQPRLRDALDGAGPRILRSLWPEAETALR